METNSISRRAALLLGGAALLPVCAARAASGVVSPLERPAQQTRLALSAAMTGLARAGRRLVAVGERGTVLLSDDAGTSWRQAHQVPVSVTLTDVRFTSDVTGYAIGHYGVVLRTDNAGEDWKKVLDGAAAAALALQESQAMPASSRDGAVRNAQRLVSEGPDKPWLALDFEDAMHGVLVGAYNTAVKTSDGAASWQSFGAELPNPKSNHLYAIAGRQSHRWIVGELGLVLHSSDGGSRFTRVPLPYAGSLFTVNLMGNSVVVCGLRGNVWRSEDDGASWKPVELPAPVTVTASVVHADMLYLANQAGQILQSRDGGRSFAVVGKAATPQISSLLVLDDGSLLAAGWRGLSKVDNNLSGAVK